MTTNSYQFTHAICRLPSESIVDGLRAFDTGQPDLVSFIHDHENYVDVLKSTGATVHVLPALREYPDSVFIEDAALCLPKGAVIMRPGAPSRLGEACEIKPVLEQMYTHVASIKGDGFIEGGDILVTETEILVGRSARTNSAGIKELSGIVAEWGYVVREVLTPKGVLHFKTDCSLLDENTILSSKRLAETGCFDGYNVVLVEEGEEACANTIRFNDIVVMPSGFSNTENKLKSLGYSVHTIGNQEAAKLDGGMSCLSLRFTPS